MAMQVGENILLPTKLEQQTKMLLELFFVCRKRPFLLTGKSNGCIVMIIMVVIGSSQPVLLVWSEDMAWFKVKIPFRLGFSFVHILTTMSPTFGVISGNMMSKKLGNLFGSKHGSYKIINGFKLTFFTYILQCFYTCYYR